jgi:hypothetical protein
MRSGRSKSHIDLVRKFYSAKLGIYIYSPAYIFLLQVLYSGNHHYAKRGLYDKIYCKILCGKKVIAGREKSSHALKTIMIELKSKL